MPYISAPFRHYLADGFEPKTLGQLTYVVFTECIEYDRALMREVALPSVMLLPALQARISRYVESSFVYDDYAGVLGSLMSAHLELERRFHSKTFNSRAQLSLAIEWYYDEIVAPYEDKKIKENGDIEWQD